MSAPYLLHGLMFSPVVIIPLQALFLASTPDPGKVITLGYGHAAIVSLLLSLSVTPAVKISENKKLMRSRRALGLYAFAYACFHAASFFTFVAGWDASWEEIRERPYIALGAFAFLILGLLAVTSNRWAVRSLRRGWKSLHKSVYLAAIAIVAHVAWQVRSDAFWALLYGGLMCCLLGMRVFRIPPLRRHSG